MFDGTFACLGTMGDATATPPPVPATAKSKTPPSKKSKMDTGSKVKVVVRVRPLLHSEIMRHASFTLRHSVERNQISMGNGKGLHEYTYDGVLPDEMMQVIFDWNMIFSFIECKGFVF